MSLYKRCLAVTTFRSTRVFTLRRARLLAALRFTVFRIVFHCAASLSLRSARRAYSRFAAHGSSPRFASLYFVLSFTALPRCHYVPLDARIHASPRTAPRRASLHCISYCLSLRCLVLFDCGKSTGGCNPPLQLPSCQECNCSNLDCHWFLAGLPVGGT